VARLDELLQRRTRGCPPYGAVLRLCFRDRAAVQYLLRNCIYCIHENGKSRLFSGSQN